MRLLLDTHAFLWWLAGDRQLSKTARAAIGDPDSDIFVSSASAWEIATKVPLEKLSGAQAVAADVASVIAGQGFAALTITVQHGQLAGSLPPPHRDRMLISQSIIERMPLVSIETAFDRDGIQRVW